jgi:hypothetical protein
VSRRDLALALIDRLWEAPAGVAPHQVYALLDGARDPAIVPWIRRRALDYTCLFAGTLTPALAAAAPYLLHLYRGEPFTRELIEKGWGRSWGVFVAAPASLEALRRHFRTFLRVRDERGRRLLFRYYDPRVLRVYLPTCNERELETVFGPVRHYFAEDAEGATVLRFGRAHPGLSAARALLPS